MSINSVLNGRVATAFVMFVIFVSMSLIALGFPEKARLMPLLVGIPGSILGFLQLLSEMHQIARDEKDAADRAAMAKAERAMFAWTFLFLAGILGFGFTYAAPLLVFGFLYLGRKESWSIALISAVATWGVLFGFFEIGFRIPLFSGLVVEWLAG